MISEQALKSFKQVWREEFKEDIPDGLAIEEAINLLTLFEHIYRPVKKDWPGDLEKADKNSK